MSATELKPCPFCGHELEQRHRRYNPYARCATDDCAGGKLPLISLDIPDDIERWNRRDREQVLAAHVERLTELVRRFSKAMRAYEMDVDSDSPPPRDHRAMMSDAEAILEAKPEVSLARLIAEKQAEALERYSRIITEEWIDKGQSYGLRVASGQALIQANRLRRQAEEPG